MSDAIDRILKEREAAGIWLGSIQRHRLLQLLQRYREAVLWDGASGVTEPGVPVVVLNSASAPRMELLVSSLHENSIVIIPFGENPAFDFLKSKLHPYGSIGSQGPTAPHQVWWGGAKPLSVPTGFYRKEETLFTSLFRSGLINGERAATLTKDLDRLSLDHVVEGPSQEMLAGTSSLPKIDFIIRQWERSNLPIFWIDPDARVRQHPLLPQSIGCDFAIHRHSSGEMETGVMFFHQTEAARALLDMWRRLTRDHANLPESFLLDQAWILVSSQRQLETAWLPDTYWRPAGLPASHRNAVVLYDPVSRPQSPLAYFTLPFQQARRFGRHQAPEAHLIMQGVTGARGPITVLIRDVLDADTQSVGSAIEAAAQAYASNAGGFSQMEVVLCAWNKEVEAVLQIEDGTWVLVTDPSERLAPDAFSKEDMFDAVRIASGGRQVSGIKYQFPSGRLKNSGKYRGFLKRPLLPAYNE
ncbi:MAG: hypothetical protein HXX15_14205 [Rhodopseudomonas sp.]|uniref:hypothetical protein n=1 Tax=Rhodopseudomonas sp. TaxID=1078 RepID=UPI001825796E|nr:hypothetical protein [Rhodopseudomonas sp.]NVN87228.1 hypothetical protein [Rhodopseudomonas sp.]